MPRILIADDHGLYRKGLRVALEAALDDVHISEADCLDATFALLEAKRDFDLVLLDLNMPGMMSLESIRAARECYPGIRFAIVSASEDRSDILNSLAAGVHGFVSKLQPDEEIIAAVHHILVGGIYVPPLVAQLGFSGPSADEIGEEQEVDLGKLTPRQRDVLPLMARGLSNKEIARALNIAEATAKIHAAALFRVLGVRNRTEAAVKARVFLDRIRSFERTT
jgi:DNA-binding NarL/FixJ family response regulator